MITFLTKRSIENVISEGVFCQQSQHFDQPSIFYKQESWMLDKHDIQTILIKKKKSNPLFQHQNIKLIHNLSLTKCRSQMVFQGKTQEMGLGSIHEYIDIDNKSEPFWLLSKNKTSNDDFRKYDIKQAQRILLDSTKEREERVMASKIIAETMLKNIYGEKLKIIQQQQRQKQNFRPKNLINLCSLEVVMNEMEYNPRSQSIMLRKEELQRLKQFGRQQKSKKNLFCSASSGGYDKIEVMYRLKNQYFSLKSIIIPTKSQQYDYFVSFYNKQTINWEQSQKGTASSNFFKTMVSDFKLPKPNDQTLMKQSEIYQKLYAHKNSSTIVKQSVSHFVQNEEQLVMQNILQMKAPIFMYVLSQICFSQLKNIKLKSIRIAEDLLHLFLDYLKAMSNEINCINSFEISSVNLTNRLRFSEKLSQLLSEMTVRYLKLESLQLSTSEFNRISYGLLENEQIEEISLRHNKIDILGVRNMEILTKKLQKLKYLDVRSNDIPHYANLKDKSSLIIFF